MARYEISVRGRIDAQWASWFEGMAIDHALDGDSEPVTLLRGEVTDQAALRGLISRIWDLNMTLLALRELQEPCPAQSPAERNTQWLP